MKKLLSRKGKIGYVEVVRQAPKLSLKMGESIAVAAETVRRHDNQRLGRPQSMQRAPEPSISGN